MVTLPITSAYTEKDQKKADIANKFIGYGSPRSSTNAYREAYGSNANSGSYEFGDVVFISAEGARNNRLSIPVAEIKQAAMQDVVFITDTLADRSRAYNVGEREVQDLLESLGYIERNPGYWVSPNYSYNFNILRGDLFHMDADAICITTNGFTKKNGDAVMGRGCAKKASEHLPELPKMLGNLLRTQGNQVHHLIDVNEISLMAFPVKPVSIVYVSPDDVVTHMRDKFSLGDTVPGYAAVADINIIEQSCQQLVQIANEQQWDKVIIPKPGCGAGELAWSVVAPVLHTYLDSRFYVVTF